MTTRQEEIERASQAQALIEAPLMVEAFATVSEALAKAWRDTTEAQERERERLWLMLKLLSRVKAHLESVIMTGKMADRQLSEIEKRRGWKVV